MLLNFSFKNFKSYAGECNFSMLAGRDNTLARNLVEIDGKERVSKVHIIYGANASGKSSFIDAMKFVQKFVADSNKLLEHMPIPVRPFKFRKNFDAVPSEFNIVFEKDGIKYVYSFSCTKEKVIEENLDVYYSAKPTKIFARKDSNQYKFLKRDEKLLCELKERNLPNKLFLVTAATWNYEPAKPVVEFLFNGLDVLKNIEGERGLAIAKVASIGADDEYKKFCMSLLNNADIGISDFNLEIKEDYGFFGNEALRAYFKAQNRDVDDIFQRKPKTIKVMTYHEIGAEKEKYALNIGEESLGTIRIFEYAPILFDVLKKGKVLFIDEIDRSLHPLLVKHLVKIFLNEKTNPNGAQLIANTHDTNLLDLDLLRRDEIWFAARDDKTGSTEMYPLSDFSPRKTENVEKAYLLGRYGAVPFIAED